MASSTQFFSTIILDCKICLRTYVHYGIISLYFYKTFHKPSVQKTSVTAS